MCSVNSACLAKKGYSDSEKVAVSSMSLPLTFPSLLVQIEDELASTQLYNTTQHKISVFGTHLANSLVIQSFGNKLGCNAV